MRILTSSVSVNRYFGSKPTSVTSESNVRIGDSSMPWERDDESKMSKYQYHPHGDKSQALRDAPSALNTVVVPKVTLPKVFLSLVAFRALWPDRFVALGKCRMMLTFCRISMSASTSMARRSGTTNS